MDSCSLQGREHGFGKLLSHWKGKAVWALSCPERLPWAQDMQWHPATVTQGLEPMTNSLHSAPHSSRNCPEWHISVQTHENCRGYQLRMLRYFWALGAPLSFICEYQYAFLDWWQPLLKKCHGNAQGLSAGINPRRISSVQSWSSFTPRPTPVSLPTTPRQGWTHQSGHAAFCGVWSFILALITGNFVLSRQKEPWVSSGGKKLLVGAVCVTGHVWGDDGVLQKALRALCKHQRCGISVCTQDKGLSMNTGPKADKDPKSGWFL